MSLPLPQMLHLSLKFPNVIQNIPKQLQRWFDEYKILTTLCSDGVNSLALLYDTTVEQIQELLYKGSVGSTNSERELKLLIAQSVDKKLQANTTLLVEEKVSVYTELSTFLNNSNVLSIVDDADDTFEKVLCTATDDTYFSTGFVPLDTLTQVTNGTLMLLIAPSGIGKTSVMLSLANALKVSNAVSRVVYVTLEMTSKQVKLRAKHLKGLNEHDTIIQRVVSISALESYVDASTALFIDYADLLVSSNNELRFSLNKLYVELTSLARKCKILITASQPRDANNLSMFGNESSAKTHYSSLICTLERTMSNETNTYLELGIRKNRYGKSNVKSLFSFNYETLEYEHLASGDLAANLSISDW